MSNQTRRDFLKKTAGVFAAPYIITSTALGRGGVPPASERVTVAHIGAGGRGNALARSFLELKEAQVVAVCDCFESRQMSTAKAIDEFYAKRDGNGTGSGCAMYGDFRKLLADESIDAVAIATPDHWHIPTAIAAVRAGKDIYVEKPLGLAVAWNQALRETVNRYGAVFQYGTQQRSGHNFRFACELARNGYLGELERIQAWCPGMAAPGWYEKVSEDGGSTVPIPVPDGFDYDMWIGPAPMSPYTKDRCTQWGAYHVYDYALGFIAGWGAHPLDIAQWGNDTDDQAPVEYQGTGVIPTEGLFDTISDWDMHCRYANGVTMRFMNTNKAIDVVKGRPFCDHGTTFFGSKDWVSVDRGGIYASDEKLLKITLKESDTHLYESGNHSLNFVNCVKSRADTVSPVETAVQSDIISHLSDISIRLKRSIKWDAEKEEIIGDGTAARLLNRAMRSPWRL